MNKSTKILRRGAHPVVGPVLALLLIALGVSLRPIPALADESEPWLLEERAGQVRLVNAGVAPVSLTTGDVFASGQWIETGPDGRAVLRRGSETIVVAPNSRIGLPQENTGTYATRILQTLGTILLKVDKKATQHFEVQTPYLAAVVKGTTFTVGIEGPRAAVHVVEGLVEVRELASGLSTLVHPGQTGAVFRGSGLGVTIQGARPESAGGRAEPQRGPAPSARGAGAVVIAETIGAGGPDLAATTGGLVRDAKPANDLSVASGGAQAPAHEPTAIGAVEGVRLSGSSLPDSLPVNLRLGVAAAPVDVPVDGGNRLQAAVAPPPAVEPPPVEPPVK